MLNVYTVVFFGHRYIDDVLTVERVLCEWIRKLIDKKEYVEFLVGRNGDFDRIASSAVRRVKKEYRDDNSSLVLVLPYITAEYEKNKTEFEEYYDSIEISFDAASAFPKAAIQLRNKRMVERADLIICCVERSGGAKQAVEYAKKLGKPVINICNN